MSLLPDRSSTSATIKIIGLGQSLRGDDAAGLEAVRYWQDNYAHEVERPDLQAELAGQPGVGLLNLLTDCSTAILVDAVRSNAEAGTIHILPEEQLEKFTGTFGSAHSWGVAETLALGRKLIPTEMPKKLVLIGIEASDLSMGAPLSPLVQQAIPEAARLIEQLATGNPPPNFI